MEEESYRNLVILLLCILIVLYIYDLAYARIYITKNIEKTLPEKTLTESKSTKKTNNCDKNICIIDKKIKKKHKEDEEIKSIGDINNSLDDIESVVKKISNI